MIPGLSDANAQQKNTISRECTIGGKSFTLES